MGAEIIDATHRPRPGRPEFKPTPALRRAVMLQAATGTPEFLIARAIGIGRTALRRHFSAELATGRARKIGENLSRLELAARAGRVSAMIALDRIMVRAARRAGQ